MGRHPAAERVPVLMYHRVGASDNAWERKYCVAPERFASHMRALVADGYRACGIDEMVDWLGGRGDLPRQSFLLTFDDGFLGVYEHAAPVLRDLGWPATVFLVSELIGKHDQWTARQNPSGRTYPLLGKSEIDAMARQGVSFHSHTRGHPDLTGLSDAALAAELSGARSALEDLLGKPVPYLAYPYGRYDERVVAATKAAGYRAAFSVQPGFNRPGLDPYQIRRIDVFGTDSAAQLLRKVRLGSNDGSLAAEVRYVAKRLSSRLGLRSADA